MDFRPYVREHLAPLAIDREVEIVEELAQHLEEIYREARDEGLDHAAAWARAAGALPDAADGLARVLRTAVRAPPGRAADRMRAALHEPSPVSRGNSPMLTDLRRDLRYAFRALVRDPGFTAAVVITLAIGIGAVSSIFSAIDAVLLRNAAVAGPDRLVSVYTVWAGSATATPRGGSQIGGSSYPDFLDLRDSGILKGLAAFTSIGLDLDTNGITERIDAELVSGSYFDVLGVRPVVGRAFRPDEDRIGSPVRVVVVSHRMWQQRLGGEIGVAGRSIVLNGSRYTVIGVAPRGFASAILGNVPEAWVPMALQEELRPPSAALRRELGGPRLLGARSPRWLDIVGRLQDGSSVSAAAAAIDVAGRRLAGAYPESNRDLSATAVPLGDGPGVRTRSRPVLALLMAAVALVLLIACANVASLLLARAVTRRREVAVRVAIGAGRGQLVRQWLTEAVILGIAGAALGVVVGSWSTPVLHGLGIPRTVDLHMSPRVLGFTMIVGVATGLLFGLAPVLQLVRGDTLSALREEGGAVASGVRASRLRSVSVVLQVALSLVLLVGAGLFVRTLQQAYAVDLGYRIDRMLVADLNLGERYTPDAGLTLYQDLLTRLNTLPGIVSASAARVTVLSGTSRTLPVSADGQPMRTDRSNVIPARANVVSGRYLETMGIPVVRGRSFTDSDVQTSPRVAIVSRALAHRLWGDADPVGQSLVSTSRFEVIGVVPDTVYLNATERDPRPFFYIPLTQNYESVVTLHLRTGDDPLAMFPAVREIVRKRDARLAVTRPRLLLDEFDSSIAQQRTLAILVAALGGVALLLAAVGLYSVMAYGTRQRTTEIGLRLALGATPASILNLIVMRGATLVLTGTALGGAAAVVGVRYIRSLLFGIEATDPVTWLAVAGGLLLVGLVACVIPARHAMRISPVQALRSS